MEDRICDNCHCFLDERCKCINCGEVKKLKNYTYGTMLNPYTSSNQEEGGNEEEDGPDDDNFDEPGF